MLDSPTFTVDEGRCNIQELFINKSPMYLLLIHRDQYREFMLITYLITTRPPFLTPDILMINLLKREVDTMSGHIRSI